MVLTLTIKVSVISNLELVKKKSHSLFLVSQSLTQHVILGYNFSKGFHMGTTCNRNDQMCLRKNGKVIETTVSNNASNALAQCTEVITLPPFTNALIKCKVPKVLKSKQF